MSFYHDLDDISKDQSRKILRLLKRTLTTKMNMGENTGYLCRAIFFKWLSHISKFWSNGDTLFFYHALLQL